MRCLAFILLPASLACAAQAVVGAVSSSTIPVPPFGSTVVNSPISLVEVRTRMQTLADGTHIVRRTREMFYRDEQGRTRTETETTPSGMANVVVHNVNVNDPVAGTVITWTESPAVGRKEYFTRNVKAVPLLADAPPPSAQPPVRVPTGASSTVVSVTARPEVRREDLGTRDVQGLSCIADRTTTTYPVDFLGNDRPIVVTDERCVSRELGRTLLQTRDDPRSGVLTVTVESLSHNSPQSALFQPPVGYVEHAVEVGVRPAQ